jgi:hypothetical protein
MQAGDFSQILLRNAERFSMASQVVAERLAGALLLGH